MRKILIDDKLWAEFFANPREETFGPIYEQSRALVWTLCYRVLHNEEDARDAFQSVYCRLLKWARDPRHRELPQIHQRGIYYLALREANNLRMRRSRRARKEVAMETLPVVTDTGARTDQAIHDRETRGLIEGIISTLPDRYRLPLLLHYFHGMTHKEIAMSLGKPASTISSRIATAHRKLEPLMRRAGLGGAAMLLGAIGARASLIEPPAGLDLAGVFKHIQEEVGAGAAMAGGSGTDGAVTSGTATPSHFALRGIQSKLAVLGLSVAILGGLALLVHRINATNPYLMLGKRPAAAHAQSDAAFQASVPGGQFITPAGGFIVNGAPFSPFACPHSQGTDAASGRKNVARSK